MVAFFASGADDASPAGGRLTAHEARVLEAIDDEETLKLLTELIAEPSENPPGAEAACARLLASFLEQRGIACHLAEAAPGRPNLYATVGSPGPTLVLCGHLDTVPAGEGWTFDPFGATVAAGLVYGRGACDMKAGLAAMAAALVAVRRSGVVLHGNLALHAVVDEEVGSTGARKAALEHPGAFVVVAEPSGLQVLARGNGQLNFEIVFHGRAVHSSHPEDGRNAIGDAAGFVRLVEEENLRLATVPEPGIGPATYSVGLIKGGLGGSTVADRCELTLDRRVLPSEDPEAAEEAVRGLLGRLATKRPGLRSEMSRSVSFPPLRGRNNEHLETVLNRSLADLGHRQSGERSGMRFATDAAWYEAAGCPAVVFGPGDVAVAHQSDEHVALRDVKAATRALALCGVRLLT
ncbi:MAG: M20 family metallopeptidase [Acidimicrobiales bacterium]|jgi:acetylornithine deacetylase